MPRALLTRVLKNVPDFSRLTLDWRGPSREAFRANFSAFPLVDAQVWSLCCAREIDVQSLESLELTDAHPEVNCERE